MAEHGRVDAGEVGLSVRHYVEVGDDRVDALVGGGRPHRQPAAEAEAERADSGSLEALVSGQLVHGGAHVELGLVHRHGHHQLLGLVGPIGGLAAEEVGRERQEAGDREAVADVLDLVIETPPLLQDDGGRTASESGTAR